MLVFLFLFGLFGLARCARIKVSPRNLWIDLGASLSHRQQPVKLYLNVHSNESQQDSSLVGPCWCPAPRRPLGGDRGSAAAAQAARTDIPGWPVSRGLLHRWLIVESRPGNGLVCLACFGPRCRESGNA